MKTGSFVSGAPYPLNDLSRQRPDVSAPVAANFRFVVHSAERQTRELASQGARNGFAQRSFAHARRPDKAQNRPFMLGFNRRTER